MGEAGIETDSQENEMRSPARWRGSTLRISGLVPRTGTGVTADGTVAWCGPGTRAAWMPGEPSVQCFMISGLTLDLVVTADWAQMDSPSFERVLRTCLQCLVLFWRKLCTHLNPPFEKRMGSWEESLEGHAIPAVAVEADKSVFDYSWLNQTHLLRRVTELGSFGPCFE